MPDARKHACAVLLLLSGLLSPWIVSGAVSREALSSAVHLVAVRDDEAAQGAQGSGVLFGDFRILTNAHVIYDKQQQRPYGRIEASFTLNPKELPTCRTRARVIAFDLDRDLAVLELMSAPTNECETDDALLGIGTSPTPVRFREDLLLSSSVPDIGETLTLLGYPSATAGGITVTRGNVSAYGYANDGSIVVIKTDAQASGGSSGGPAFDERGYTIGMVTAVQYDQSTVTKFAWVITVPTINAWIADLVAQGKLAVQDAESGMEGCFPDVPADYPGNAAICALYAEGVLKGYQDGTFQPSREVNRAELLAILVRGGLGMEPGADAYHDCFTDIRAEWYAPYVCYAQGNGMVSGYPDGTFKPGRTVSRAEAVKMALSVLQLPILEATESSFTDVQTNDWFSPFAETALQLHLVDAASSFDPASPMSRADISELLYRALVLRKTKGAYYGQGNEYVNEQWGVRIGNPVNWTRHEGVPNVLVLFRDPAGAATVNLVAEKLPKAVSALEYWTTAQKQFEQIKTPKFSVQKSAESQFQGLPAMHVSYILDANTGHGRSNPDLISQVYQLIFVQGNTAYVLSYGAPRQAFMQTQDEALQIINSFAFTE